MEKKELHKENKNPYYKLIANEEIYNKVLENFEADIKDGHTRVKNVKRKFRFEAIVISLQRRHNKGKNTNVTILLHLNYYSVKPIDVFSKKIYN